MGEGDNFFKTQIRIVYSLQNCKSSLHHLKVVRANSFFITWLLPGAQKGYLPYAGPPRPCGFFVRKDPQLCWLGGIGSLKLS